MAKSNDSRTLELIREVKRRKEEIAAAERPQYVTNCTFRYVEGSSNVINLHVESDVRILLEIAGFLIGRQRDFLEAIARVGVTDAPLFTWGGYNLAEWLQDIRTRMAKVQITHKRRKLEELEARLNSIVSPELRAKLELEAIETALGD